MQFVVDIRPSLPPEWAKEHLTAMLQGETDAAIAFMERGVLVRIDRVVGRGGNISIWETDSFEALDQALASLPLAPWLQFDVTPVVKHRADRLRSPSESQGCALSAVTAHKGVFHD